jgi:hypothetical protein
VACSVTVRRNMDTRSAIDTPLRDRPPSGPTLDLSTAAPGAVGGLSARISIHHWPGWGTWRAITPAYDDTSIPHWQIAANAAQKRRTDRVKPSPLTT